MLNDYCCPRLVCCFLVLIHLKLKIRIRLFLSRKKNSTLCTLSTQHTPPPTAPQPLSVLSQTLLSDRGDWLYNRHISRVALDMWPVSGDSYCIRSDVCLKVQLSRKKFSLWMFYVWRSIWQDNSAPASRNVCCILWGPCLKQQRSQMTTHINKKVWKLCYTQSHCHYFKRVLRHIGVPITWLPCLSYCPAAVAHVYSICMGAARCLVQHMQPEK